MGDLDLYVVLLSGVVILQGVTILGVLVVLGDLTRTLLAGDDSDESDPVALTRD